MKRFMHAISHLFGWFPCRLDRAIIGGHEMLVTRCAVCERMFVLTHSVCCKCGGKRRADAGPKKETMTCDTVVK
mgnify:CR=1 FL=1